MGLILLFPHPESGQPAGKALVLEGSAATTALTTSGTSHTINLPTGIQAGELIYIAGASTNRGVNGLPSFPAGWQGESGASDSGESLNTFAYWIVATGSEGSSITVTTTGNAQIIAVAARFSGAAKTTAKFSAGTSGTGNVGSSQASFNIAQDFITGLRSNSGALVFVAAASDKTVSSADGDLSSVGGVNNSTLSGHLYYDGNTNASGNPQYDFTMSAAADFDYRVVEGVTAKGASAAARMFMRF